MTSSRSLDFDVAMLPAMVHGAESRVCVVVDVIRASSTVVALFERGCREVLLSRDTGAVDRTGKDGVPVSVCAEEVSGLAASDADFSPSLMSVAARNLSGHRVFLRTTNGTAAIHYIVACGAKSVLVGSLMNLASVMRQAVDAATSLGTDVVVVCAGRDGGTTFALDDVYCAGRLIAEGERIAAERGIPVTQRDSAKAAVTLAGAYGGALQAFSGASSAEVLRRANCEADIALCARDNICDVVPGLVPGPPDLLRFVDLSSSTVNSRI